MIRIYTLSRNPGGFQQANGMGRLLGVVGSGVVHKGSVYVYLRVLLEMPASLNGRSSSSRKGKKKTNLLPTEN